MATTAVGTGLPTLLDKIKALDPDGKIAVAVELLQQKNAMLEDAVVVEGNTDTGYVYTTRTALPSVGWRRFNEGIDSSKSRRDQISEACGMLSGRSEIDVDLAKLGGNAPAFRADEDKGFLASMSNEVESSIAYATQDTAPEEFNGFMPRLDDTTAPNGDQIVLCDDDASGNDQASILLVNWSPQSNFLFYPKGSTVGIESKDMGEQYVEDADGKRFRAFCTDWTWKVGLASKDYRQLVRVANIDAVKIAAGTSPLIESMIEAYYRLYDPKMGRNVWYVNRAVQVYLHLKHLERASNQITYDNVGGKPVMFFMGIPVRLTDALLSTESVVA